MKTYAYNVPLTKTLKDFIEYCKIVLGSLTGGFQSWVNWLLESIVADRLNLDDVMMGKAYRMRWVGKGGMQQTHLPKFLDEMARLFKTGQAERGHRAVSLFDA